MDDFQVFVKPVGAICNLACQYCYYTEKEQLYPEKSGFRMPDDLLEAYIIQHIGAATGPELFFSWHGGEPTLGGLQFFERVITLQQKHLPANWSIINGLQTNGTLLSHEWCRFLKKENFVVGISLDGPGELHSSFRIRKDGQPCFEEVLQGYNLLRQYEIPCEILCVVNSVNVNYPLEIWRFFRELKAGFITFLPLVEQQTSSTKQVSDRTVPAKAFGEFLCTIFDQWKTSGIGSVKIQIVEEVLRTAFGMEHTLCIFKRTCGGVPVLERNGDLFACDHFVNHDYLLGNIRETPFSTLLGSRVQHEFGQAKLTSLPDYCLRCEVREMCNGACPKDRFICTPEGKPGLNYLCEGYKLFFGHCNPFIEQVARAWAATPDT